MFQVKVWDPVTKASKLVGYPVDKLSDLSPQLKAATKRVEMTRLLVGYERVDGKEMPKFDLHPESASGAAFKQYLDSGFRFVRLIQEIDGRVSAYMAGRNGIRVRINADGLTRSVDQFGRVA